MELCDILALADAQKRYFEEGRTLPLSARLKTLAALLKGIAALEGEIHAALHADLGKSPVEAHFCEVSTARAALRHAMTHLKGWMRPPSVPLSLLQWPGRGRVIPHPYGSVLVLSPWNYPFLLALQPAIEALSAGNTVVIKPSEHAPHTAAVLEALFTRCLPPEVACVIPGGSETGAALLDYPFDYFFYTGGPEVGRLVMEKAARHLAPLTLELGGKSPCIVDETADLSLAARRIVFGKFLNCGQTCIAPDYLWVQESVQEPLMEALSREIIRQYGEKPLENPQYGRIVNRRHFERLFRLLENGDIRHGGVVREETLQIAPTLLESVTRADPVMQEEIFGPILPVLTYESLDEVVRALAPPPHPLALYLFSRNLSRSRKLLERLPFGGGCLNDTVLHIASHSLPFGGLGGSGIGAYHGRAGFDTFSHQKSILEKGPWPDPSLRYPPYTPGKARLLRRLMD